MYRSKAGGQDLEDDDEDEEGVVDDDDTEINYRNNSHWKRAADCGLSNYVSYYDAASLYPSSGKNNNKTLQQSGNIYHPHNPTQRPLPPPPHDKVPRPPLALTRAASYARIPSLSLPPSPCRAAAAARRRRRGGGEEEWAVAMYVRGGNTTTPPHFPPIF